MYGGSVKGEDGSEVVGFIAKTQLTDSIIMLLTIQTVRVLAKMCTLYFILNLERITVLGYIIRKSAASRLSYFN